MMTFKMMFYLLVMAFVLPSMPVFAQQCDSGRAQTSPDHLFIIKNDGTVKDRNTNLQWMRCSLGQVWQDGRCAFTQLTYNFHEAFVAVSEFNRSGGIAIHQDWRLPTLKELATIVEQRCEDPAINTNAFPDAPVTGYWSTTRDPDYSDGAMLVHLLTGHSYMGNINVAWALRLVRKDK
jgi:hypothetical protein